MSKDRLLLIVLAGLVTGGVAVLRLLMAMTRSVYVGELFMVFVDD